MESTVEKRPFGQLSLCWVLHRQEVHFIQTSPQSVDIVPSAHASRHIAGVLLNDHPKLENLEELLRIERSYCEAPTRPQGYQSLSCKMIERFAQGRSAYAETLRQLLLPKDLSGLQDPVEYSLADPSMDYAR